VLVSKDKAALDLYVAGTMCTPFSPKGARGGFADPKAKTFYQFFKTLATMQPRAAVLENSPGILDKRNRAELLAILKTARGYCRRAYTLRTSK
jgi:site-specific DNA-cytosine methylase